jgi:hypothetical protein
MDIFAARCRTRKVYKDPKGSESRVVSRFLILFAASGNLAGLWENILKIPLPVYVINDLCVFLITGLQFQRSHGKIAVQ